MTRNAPLTWPTPGTQLGASLSTARGRRATTLWRIGGDHRPAQDRDGTVMMRIKIELTLERVFHQDGVFALRAGGQQRDRTFDQLL